MQISFNRVVGFFLLAGYAAASIPSIEIKVCDLIMPSDIGLMRAFTSDAGTLSPIGIKVLLLQQRH